MICLRSQRRLHNFPHARGMTSQHKYINYTLSVSNPMRSSLCDTLDIHKLLYPCAVCLVIFVVVRVGRYLSRFRLSPLASVFFWSRYNTASYSSYLARGFEPQSASSRQRQHTCTRYPQKSRRVQYDGRSVKIWLPFRPRFPCCDIQPYGVLSRPKEPPFLEVLQF